MIPWVVLRADERRDSRVIGGGSQSARNLIEGMKQLAADIRIVTWRTGAAGDGGVAADLVLPPPRTWRDESAAEPIRALLGAGPPPNVIHLLEVEGYLGCWLQSAKRVGSRSLFSALDYAWLCATSRLLTKRLTNCLGPRSPASCISCYFDHRHLTRRLVLRTQLASTWLLPRGFDLPLIGGRVAKARGLTAGIESRLACLTSDFALLDRLIAPSRILGDLFASNGFDRSKIRVIPYGTQTGSRVPWDQRPPACDGLVLGFVGRPSFDKGFDSLVRGLHGLRRAGGRRVKLRVFGRVDFASLDADVRRILAQGLESWIHVGEFDGADPRSIDEAHRQIHVVVAPSRWTDNLPNSVLEALARRTPVIAPRFGSFPEMISDGDNGWLYEPGQTGLEAALRAAVDHPHRLRDLPHHRTVTRPPEAEAAEVLHLYEELNASRDDPAPPSISPSIPSDAG